MELVQPGIVSYCDVTMALNNSSECNSFVLCYWSINTHLLLYLMHSFKVWACSNLGQWSMSLRLSRAHSFKNHAWKSSKLINMYTITFSKSSQDYLKLGPLELKLLSIEGHTKPLHGHKKLTDEEAKAKHSAPDVWPVTAEMLRTVTDEPTSIVQETW